MAKKTKRSKKLIRVLKRKWFKPALYTLGMSFIIYIGISSIIIQKKNIEHNVPHFLITRISDNFDETEFTHLLLTVQEINMVPVAIKELKDFVNKPYPAACPPLLTRHLNRMNWEPQAFLIRVKKMFSMLDTFQRIQRLNNTITFLDNEIKEKRLPEDLESQIAVLQEERDKLIKTELPNNEYTFIQDYAGLIQQLKSKD